MNGSKTYYFLIEDELERTELRTPSRELTDKIIRSDVGRLFPDRKYGDSGLTNGNHFIWKTSLRDAMPVLGESGYELIIYSAE